MSEREARRAAALLETYRGQIDALAKQHEVMHTSLEDVLRARETLSRYRAAGEGKELLVPVGATTYVFAQSQTPDRVLVGIGSSLIIEDTEAGARARLDARAQSLETAVQTLEARLEEIEAKAEAQGQILDEIVAREKPPG